MLGSGLIKHDVSDLHAECREPTRAGIAPASPAEGIAPNFARRDALAEAPRVADRSTAVQTALTRLGARPTGRASALHAGAGDVLAGLAGAQNRPAACGGVGAGPVLGELWRRILVPTYRESLSPDLASNPLERGRFSFQPRPPSKSAVLPARAGTGASVR